MLAYNQFSTRTGYNGRRGATKMVIFETDGVPNTRTTGSFNHGSKNKSKFTGLTVGSNVGNGNSSVLTNAKAAAQQVCNLTTASSPGYSSAKTPVRIHAIAFGRSQWGRPMRFQVAALSRASYALWSVTGNPGLLWARSDGEPTAAGRPCRHAQGGGTSGMSWWTSKRTADSTPRAR